MVPWQVLWVCRVLYFRFGRIKLVPAAVWPSAAACPPKYKQHLWPWCTQMVAGEDYIPINVERETVMLLGRRPASLAHSNLKGHNSLSMRRGDTPHFSHEKRYIVNKLLVSRAHKCCLNPLRILSTDVIPCTQQLASHCGFYFNNLRFEHPPKPSFWLLDAVLFHVDECRWPFCYAHTSADTGRFQQDPFFLE